MQPSVLLVIYCVLVVAASFAGGWLPNLVRLTHTRMQLMMSFVAGLMLGVALLHLLPHAVTIAVPIDHAAGWALAGLLAMFFLIRIFHFHEHGAAVEDEPCGEPHEGHSHAGACAHEPHAHHEHAHGAAPAISSRAGWIGVAIGLGIHTLIDGMTLAALVYREALEHDAHLLLGVAVFLVIVLHKPLDALSIASVMTSGGWDARSRLFVNIAFSLMCPLGAALFVLGIDRFAEARMTIVGSALAFSAGVFLCISLSDLLPELQFHTHDRLKLSSALLLGVALSYGVGFLESEHLHEHHHAVPHHGSAEHNHDHDHAH